MFHDTVMSLVVVAVIIALACVWYFTAEDVGEGASKPGWLGVLYEDEADPGTTSFVPRPDWYFYFLFYLLRIFKWPDTVVLGTVGIPTILLIIGLALRLPRPAVGAPRSLQAPRRDGHPDPDGDLDGRPDLQGRDGGGSRAGAILKVPEWMEQYNLPPNAREGAEIFAQSACLNCHVYDDEGSSGSALPSSPRKGRETAASSGRSTTSKRRVDSRPARRCRRSPSLARTTCASSRSSSKPPRANRAGSERRDRTPARGRRPFDVRRGRAGLRRDEPADHCWARRPLAQARRSGGREAGRPCPGRMLRHG